MSALEATEAVSPVPVPTRVLVEEGPALLAGVGDGPGLAAHLARHGRLADSPYAAGRAALVAALERAAVHGRGGAGFPFLAKLRTAGAGRRRVLVVNLAEGEPVSAKDHALATTRPHLVLDGLEAVARALGTRDLHVVVPRERPAVGRAVRSALGERSGRSGRTVVVHEAAARFVAGQSSAVLELMAGREGLPVTTWTPSARRGHRGRPTLLSNAETWAHVGLVALHGPEAYAAHGSPAAPGTTLLTLLATTGDPRVVEVALGTPLAAALGGAAAAPALVGGFHGRWLTPDDLARTRVAADTVGAGSVLSLGPGECPGELTARIVRYLAGQSAERCGPCRLGLPALADATAAGQHARALELADTVEGRGACAHPDGTARLVRSLVAAYPGCLGGHR